jgi:hypothetical protein
MEPSLLPQYVQHQARLTQNFLRPRFKRSTTIPCQLFSLYNVLQGNILKVLYEKNKVTSLGKPLFQAVLAMKAIVRIVIFSSTFC